MKKGLVTIVLAVSIIAATAAAEKNTTVCKNRAAKANKISCLAKIAAKVGKVSIQKKQEMHPDFMIGNSIIRF